MQENFTTEDLVRFIYQETDASETLAINEALEADEALYTAYENLMDGFQALPKVQFRPSEATLDSVLDYSRHATLV